MNLGAVANRDLAPDRPDIAQAAEEIVGRMAETKQEDLAMITLMARYMLDPECYGTAQSFRL